MYDWFKVHSSSSRNFLMMQVLLTLTEEQLHHTVPLHHTWSLQCTQEVHHFCPISVYTYISWRNVTHDFKLFDNQNTHAGNKFSICIANV